MCYHIAVEEITPRFVEHFSTLSAPVADESSRRVEGYTRLDGAAKYRFGIKTLKNTNCHVYIVGTDEVIIDIFVNVDYGYSIPETVCQLQETIKNDVEEATKFRVKKVNVTVDNINL